MPKQLATPASFHLSDDHPGDVYRAKTSGPPLKVEKDECPSDNAPIVIEYRDLVKATDACCRRTGDIAGALEPEDGMTRISLQPRDARHLCYVLLHALAEGGDRVATCVIESVSEAIKQLTEEEDQNA